MRLTPHSSVGRSAVALVLVAALALDLWAPIAFAQQTPAAPTPTTPGVLPAPGQPATIPVPSRPTTQPQLTRPQTSRTPTSPAEISSFPCPPGYVPVSSEQPGEASPNAEASLAPSGTNRGVPAGS